MTTRHRNRSIAGRTYTAADKAAIARSFRHGGEATPDEIATWAHGAISRALTKLKAAQTHLDILAELAQLMSNKPLRQALTTETDPAAVHRMLTTGEL